jgi:hypothetical protein
VSNTDTSSTQQRLRALICGGWRTAIFSIYACWNGASFLADEKGQHHWRKIVTDQIVFKASLLNHLKLDEAAFQQYIDTIRTYRDKFVAHFDSENNMAIPKFDTAKNAVWFYHAHIVRQEAKPGDLAGLGVQLDEGYELSEKEAKMVFSNAGKANEVQHPELSGNR